MFSFSTEFDLLFIILKTNSNRRTKIISDSVIFTFIVLTVPSKFIVCTVDSSNAGTESVQHTKMKKQQQPIKVYDRLQYNSEQAEYTGAS